MIRKIKWNNHPVLGNLELDFSKKDGSIYNTIILVGENGSGKSTILDTLCEYLKFGSIEDFDYIEYDLGTEKYKIVPDLTSNLVGAHRRINLSDGSEEKIQTYLAEYKPSKDDEKDLRQYGFSYSATNINFRLSGPIQTVGSSKLDSDEIKDDSNINFTSIKQLLINLEVEDDIKFKSLSEIERKNFNKYSKIYRFKYAFNDFFKFDEIKFNKVEIVPGTEFTVNFSRGSVDNVEIDNLSSGEKQIVFRGAQLLQKYLAVNGGTILIDEPEISMHPKWQKNVLNYYRKLFQNNGAQTAQMFFATHSEYVIKSALEDANNCLLIVLKNAKNIVTSKYIISPILLDKIIPEEVNYYAYDSVSTDFHIALYGQVQKLSNTLDSISGCDRFIKTYPNFPSNMIPLHPSNYIDRYGNMHRYETLSSYIRNSIDHPSPNNQYTEQMLRESTEFLIALIKDMKGIA